MLKSIIFTTILALLAFATPVMADDDSSDKSDSNHDSNGNMHP